MENLFQDVRFGLRMLRKNPGFAAVAILVLALGIGATTAIFTVVNSVLLQPLPYPDSERLVVIRDVQPQYGQTPMSYPAFLAWREQKDIFDQVATFTRSGEVLTGVGEPELLQTLHVSSNLLSVLGVKPILGRNFFPDEEPRNGNPVVILSHNFWQERFHSDPDVVGQKLTLTDRVFTVIGVLPAGFEFGIKDPAVLTPLRLDTEIAPSGLNFLMVMGKLRTGLSMEQARAAVNVALPRVKKLDANTEGAAIVGLQEFTVGDSRPLLLVLLSMVALVLLIACANIANLLLARGAAREKEIAIRVSLGAGRMRLSRQLLTESMLLALMGGVLGVVLAGAGVELLRSFLAHRLPRGNEVHINVEVLLFTFLLSLFTGIIFGLAPSWKAARTEPHEHLKQGGRQSAAGSASQGFRSALVVVEIMLSVVPLAGAGLLVRSFMHLLNTDRGFDSANVLTMGIWPSPSRYKDPKVEISYLQQILDNVQALPAMNAAGFVTQLPLGGGSTNGGFAIQGKPNTPSEVSNKEFVQGSYFAAMRIPLRAGRVFSRIDGPDSPKVVVVNQTFARKFFPEENPLGQHIDVSWGTPAWSEIIGVVADSRQDTVATPVQPEFYALISQKPELLKFLGFDLAVRTQVEPTSIFHSIKDRVHQLDKNQPLARVKTMDARVAESLAPRRVPMLLMLVFAALALFLAAIGIYGVLSYFVLQRRQEIGVRLALGAQRGDVLRLVLGQGAKMIVAGLALGLVAALLVSRAMASLLFDIKPNDLLTFVAISLLLALLALIACAVPALRATRVDPLVVLRDE